jgi:hypothetical protein
MRRRRKDKEIEKERKILQTDTPITIVLGNATFNCRHNYVLS